MAPTCLDCIIVPSHSFVQFWPHADCRRHTEYYDHVEAVSLAYNCWERNLTLVPGLTTPRLLSTMRNVDHNLLSLSEVGQPTMMSLRSTKSPIGLFTLQKVDMVHKIHLPIEVDLSNLGRRGFLESRCKPDSQGAPYLRLSSIISYRRASVVLSKYPAAAS